MRRQIRAVILREGEWWVAQCLEYDIATQAKTFDGLVYEIHRTIAAYAVIGKKEGIDVWSNRSKAPAIYWKLYAKAKPQSFEPVEFKTNAPYPKLIEMRFYEAITPTHGGQHGATVREL